MGSIDNAYTWAVRCCNLPNIGYSQTYRNAQTVGGITYYDCSSFINYALIAGGFSTPNYAPKNNSFTTYDMGAELLRLGFTSVDPYGEIKAGDIGVSSTHTEMCYKGGSGTAIFMGAHTSNATLANQVSIGSSSGDATYTRNFPTLYRYGGGASGEVGYTWIKGGNSQYFSSYGAEQKNNASCLYSFFFYKGWTVQAISALCGNIMQESTFNPALIEIGGTGHGLVQWTPPKNLYDVLDVLYKKHDDWDDGDKQCNVIYAEYQQSTGMKDWGIEGQWYPTKAYPMDWKTWATSTGDVGQLALAFQANYERPASLHPERAEYAKKWYEYLSTIDPYNPSGGDTEEKKKGLKVWQMVRYRRW